MIRALLTYVRAENWHLTRLYFGTIISAVPTSALPLALTERGHYGRGSYVYSGCRHRKAATVIDTNQGYQTIYVAVEEDGRIVGASLDIDDTRYMDDANEILAVTRDSVKSELSRIPVALMPIAVSRGMISADWRGYYQLEQLWGSTDEIRSMYGELANHVKTNNAYL